MQSLSRTARNAATGQRARRSLFTLVLMAAAVMAPAAAQTFEDAEPDDDAVLTAPSRFHGNWRMVARDDRGDQALMRLSIQHGVGEPAGTGDYALFQPFCEALAGEPITGMGECELEGSGVFDLVTPRRRWLVLVFRPTADGQAHTLALRLKGDQLVGEYRNADVVLPVVLQRVP